jgi:dipeptidyl aminopeptidase/acylaminoacyl peptidase
LTVDDLRAPHSDHVIYLVPSTGGPARRLTPQDVTATYWLGSWLADGSGFLVRSNAGREFQGLAVMDAISGQLSWLDTPDWDVEEARLSADGRILVWTVNIEGGSQLRARDLTTGRELAVPSLPMGQAWGLNMSRDGSRIAMLFTTPTKPCSVVSADLNSKNLSWVAEIRADADPMTLCEPDLIRYTARDGTDIPAYLYRPKGKGPHPFVMSIHGGPAAQERPEYGGEGLYQYLLSKGVGVFAPNIRGSRGYGLSYQTVLDRDWGGIDLRDLADSAAYLQEQDWVDPTRIGLFGRSYGGFAVLSCLARLPEFGWAAGVSWCGPSNLITLAKAAPPTWRSRVAVQIGDYETDAEFLKERSPVTYADQIRAPLFVLQGANDRRVPQHESDQIVERLRARGLEVRYDVYPDEGHGFSKRENETRARSDAAEFLLRQLAVG